MNFSSAVYLIILLWITQVSTRYRIPMLYRNRLQHRQALNQKINSNTTIPTKGSNTTANPLSPLRTEKSSKPTRSVDQHHTVSASKTPIISLYISLGEPHDISERQLKTNETTNNHDENGMRSHTVVARNANTTTEINIHSLRSLKINKICSYCEMHTRISRDLEEVTDHQTNISTAYGIIHINLHITLEPESSMSVPLNNNNNISTKVTPKTSNNIVNAVSADLEDASSISSENTSSASSNKTADILVIKENITSLNDSSSVTGVKKRDTQDSECECGISYQSDLGNLEPVYIKKVGTSCYAKDDVEEHCKTLCKEYMTDIVNNITICETISTYQILTIHLFSKSCHPGSAWTNSGYPPSQFCCYSRQKVPCVLF